MRFLEIDPETVETVVLSHGHFDHTAGLDGFVRAVGRANVPVVIHPEFWSRRRLVLPGREPWEMPSTSRGALEGSGFQIVEERQPSFLFERSLLVTGEVDRTTDFERGFPHTGGAARRDMGARSARTRRPGTAAQYPRPRTCRDHRMRPRRRCQHCARYARRLTGLERVYAIIGGFHLSGPLFEPLIPAVIDAFAAFRPELIVPMHCTGFRAIHRLAGAFPDAVVPSCVGTRFEL